jgi:hypothetical protein
MHPLIEAQLVVEQDLPALSEAVNRMLVHPGPSGR